MVLFEGNTAKYCTGPSQYSFIYSILYISTKALLLYFKVCPLQPNNYRILDLNSTMEQNIVKPIYIESGINPSLV